MSGIKRDSLDALFSDYVRSRDKWTCRRCTKYFPEGHRQGIHCAHIFSRRHKGIRHDPDNAIALCHGCHTYFTGYPLYFATWIIEQIGRQKYDVLRMKARKPTKLTKADIEIIRQDLKRKLEALGSSVIGRGVSRGVVIYG